MDLGSLKPGVCCDPFAGAVLCIMFDASGHGITFPSLFIRSELASLENQTRSAQTDVSCLGLTLRTFAVSGYVLVYRLQT